MNNEVPNYPQGRLIYTVTEYDPDTSQLLWRYDADTWNEAVHWCVTEDLVKLAKPKYIIKLVSNSKTVTYVGQVKDGEVSTIITKYYRTIKPEKAMVFGNKENAENFIKNNLKPNRKFEVITK